MAGWWVMAGEDAEKQEPTSLLGGLRWLVAGIWGGCMAGGMAAGGCWLVTGLAGAVAGRWLARH